ncbi:thiamine phosphate synthase [Spiribacter pallidus]|uniref:Thiamine-phosphate synthase n=1 Tax=Spiribacter pallidus TaxID=1987936 RepID=A0ABV3TAR4_9GAMM
MTAAGSITGLYAITAPRRAGQSGLLDAAAATLGAGARVLQYRDKSDDADRRLTEATALAALCRQHGAAFIINDDVDLALQANADGVHVGRDDAGVARARSALGPGRVLGVSCYADLDRAGAAVEAGADYLAFGSVYPSPTKPQAGLAPLDILAEARRRFALPVVAIGGITADNIGEVTAAGADAVAVVDAVFGADDPRSATAALIHRGFSTQGTPSS